MSASAPALVPAPAKMRRRRRRQRKRERERERERTRRVGKGERGVVVRDGGGGGGICGRQGSAGRQIDAAAAVRGGVLGGALTLYVPPVRCLNHFVAALEAMLREAAPSSLRAYLRLRLGFRRLRFALLRFLRW
uniref:Uncharacterized protein n=1 Tax=Ananas comosus var. bracteatus TaxID=296719 RepID=A0A6V7Q3W8_ANACO|nr:unnamed protein product [Ananas comosus var. bracteatus]